MTKLLALGDSHLQALKFAADFRLLAADECQFCIVPGATAAGMRNPNSATNALNNFMAAAANTPRASCILIHLGEVDCGFVMWWRCQKYGEPIAQQVQHSLTAYRKFIQDLRSMGFNHLCITSASLPTIRDGVDFGEVANLRSEVVTTLQERTQLTLAYNRELELMAKELSCTYIEMANAFLDHKTGVISDFFRSSNPTDHHLDIEKSAGVWALVCNKFLHCSASHTPTDAARPL